MIYHELLIMDIFLWVIFPVYRHGK